MAALRELAATCAYATMEDEMLRDQLLEKAYAPAVRERLLMETSLTLDSAITLACQVEQALQLSSVLMGAAAVHAVAPQKPRYRRDNRRRSDPATNRPPQRAQQKQRTYTLTHLANATDCPASQAKCNSCGKTGHFSKVCRSAKQVREVMPEVVVLMTSSDLANATDRIQCNVAMLLQESLQHVNCWWIKAHQFPSYQRLYITDISLHVPSLSQKSSLSPT